MSKSRESEAVRDMRTAAEWHREIQQVNGDAPNSILFTIPDNEWLTANKKLHWAEKSRRARALRERAHYQSLNALRRGTLKPAYGRVRVIAGIQYRTSRSDPNNVSDTVKHLIDGMVDAGVFIDDAWQYLVGPDMRRVAGRPPKGTHTIAIMIEEIGGEKDGDLRKSV